MTVMRLAGFAALSVLIAACSPAPVAEQAAPETAAPETAAPDTAAPDTAAPEATGPAAAALHVLLVENAEDLVPSDWTTGEPVSETSLSYWVLPALDVAETRSAVCTP